MTARRLRVETTAGCGIVPVLLFALENGGHDYAIHVRGTGAIERQYEQPGPVLLDGDNRHVGLSAALSALGCTPPVPDALFRNVGMATRDYVGARMRNEDVAAPRAQLDANLEVLARALDQPVTGTVDAGEPRLAILPRLQSLGVELSRWPLLVKLATEVAARPAFASAMAGYARLGETAVATSEEVLDYWFGEPARTFADLERKMRRWFMEAALLDDELRARFGPTIDHALAGELDHWADEPRGRLALIVVLDQLTRQAFRGHALAFAGDQRALALALDALDRGWHESLPVERATMMAMPLVHAEDLTVQERSVELRRQAKKTAPAELAPFFEIALEQAIKHRDWIARFGRFPGRNAALGRTSTPEEVEFLATFEQIAAPRRYQARN